MSSETPQVNDKREIFGWAMYDWANSAFATTIMAGFMPIYFRTLAVNAGLTEVSAHLLGRISPH